MSDFSNTSKTVYKGIRDYDDKKYFKESNNDFIAYLKVGHLKFE
jgi:hypothetical protein